MQLLKNIIATEGTLINNSVLKVDKFINQKIDAHLMNEIANEFYEYYKNEEIDLIVTVEASGIAPAILVALRYNVPLLVLRKGDSILLDDVYEADVKSFTKGTKTKLSCNKYNLNNNRCLFIDDFLAYGEAVYAVKNIIEQSNSTLVGTGFIIEKSFQPGRSRLDSDNIKVCSLVRIETLQDGIKYLKGDADE